MFKKGDIITCIDAKESENRLTNYKEYIVLDTHKFDSMIEIISDDGRTGKWFDDRFVSLRGFLIREMFEKFK